MASNDSEAPSVQAGPRPLVGLTTYLEPSRHGVWDVESALLPAAYAEGVRRAGGRAVLLPPLGAWTAAELADLDGIVLTGGADVDPTRYGAEPAATTAPPQPGRDESELALVHTAESVGLPILGICRGAQVLNVAHGGTLHQHLPDVLGHSGHQVSPAVFSDTEVDLAEGSVVGGVYGGRVTVRCYHHQGIATLGDGLRAVGHAADGVIEAIEGSGTGPMLLGLQWHPEQQLDDLRPFRAIVDAARERRRYREGGPLRRTPREEYA